MQASTLLAPPQLPPGPRSLPLLGALPFLVKAPDHQSLGRLARRYGDVFLFHIGNVPTVVISHPELMVDAFQQANTWQRDSPHTGPDSNQGQDLPGTAGRNNRLRLRRFTEEKLSGPGVRQMLVHNHAEPMVEELLERWQHLAEWGKCINPQRDLDNIDYNLSFRAVFGNSRHDSLDFLSLKSQLREHIAWTNATNNSLHPSTLLSWLKFHKKRPEQESKLLQLDRDRIVAGLIEGVRRRPEFDPAQPTCLAEIMLAAQAEGTLDWTEVRSLCCHVLTGASSGLGRLLGWLLVLLANRPVIQAGIHEEMERELGWGEAPTADDRGALPYTFACITECMRYLTVTPLSSPLRAIRSTEIGGYHVPAGSQALVNIHAIHHDERFWAVPQVFRPKRFLPERSRSERLRSGPDGSPTAPVMPFGITLGANQEAATVRELAESAIWLFATRLLNRFQFETREKIPLTMNEVLGMENSSRTYLLRMIPQR